MDSVILFSQFHAELFDHTFLFSYRGFDSRLSRCELMTVKLVNALPKVVGFLLVLRFLFTGNVRSVGWDKPQTDPSTIAVLRDQT
jgi:hypothetical protein